MLLARGGIFGNARQHLAQDLWLGGEVLHGTIHQCASLGFHAAWRGRHRDGGHQRDGGLLHRDRVLHQLGDLLYCHQLHDLLGDGLAEQEDGGVSAVWAAQVPCQESESYHDYTCSLVLGLLSVRLAQALLAPAEDPTEPELAPQRFCHGLTCFEESQDLNNCLRISMLKPQAAEINHKAQTVQARIPDSLLLASFSADPDIETTGQHPLLQHDSRHEGQSKGFGLYCLHLSACCILPQAAI